MLTEEELRATILARMHVAAESGSSWHRRHVYGQIKALVYVLTGGVVTVSEETSIQVILDLCGIPHTPDPNDADGILIPDKWMRAHELTDDYRHPRLATVW
jgi:hypothetical protein